MLYGCLFLSDDCQASFSFIPASKALSLAGLLTQLAFHRGIPSHIPEALSFIVSQFYLLVQSERLITSPEYRRNTITRRRFFRRTVGSIRAPCVVHCPPLFRFANHKPIPPTSVLIVLVLGTYDGACVPAVWQARSLLHAP